MISAPVIIAGVTSAIGLLLNCGMLYMVLSRGKKMYHYLFSAVLMICALWDLGILMSMLRNAYEKELVIYGYIVFLPGSFLAALIYQFTTTFLERPKKKTTIFLWVFSVLGVITLVTGVGGKIEGVFHYSWGNIYRPDQRLQIFSLFSIPVWWFATLSSSRMLLQDTKTELSIIKRRHMIYMAVSFIVLTLATVKLAVLYNIDNAFLLPMGMFVNDIFSALIAIAIIKHHLFNITFIVKKSALYSSLAAILIFVISFSEHVLITYFGKLIGEHSELIHLISIAVGIAILMPLKHRMEHVIEKFFAQKKMEF